MGRLRSDTVGTAPATAPQEPEQLTWLESDVEMLDQLGALIQSRATWSGTSTAEVLKLGKYLMEYQALRNKIAAHILEIRAYREARTQPSQAAGQGTET